MSVRPLSALVVLYVGAVLGFCLVDSAHADLAEQLGLSRPFTSLADPTLVGDDGAAYTHAGGIQCAEQQGWQFTAAHSGTVEAMELRTNANANPNVGQVHLGVFAEESGKPGAVLEQKVRNEAPGTSEWFLMTGFNLKVVAGTKYWLGVTCQGAGIVHFSFAVTSGGSKYVESTTNGFTELGGATWNAPGEIGPIGFRAVGSEEAGGVKHRLGMIL